jgi:hypothetical protein
MAVDHGAPGERQLRLGRSGVQARVHFVDLGAFRDASIDETRAMQA